MLPLVYSFIETDMAVVSTFPLHIPVNVVDLLWILVATLIEKLLVLCIKYVEQTKCKLKRRFG